MMGGTTPETRWAVNKRHDNKLENCCIRLVIYLNCTMMHGLTNLKSMYFCVVLCIFCFVLFYVLFVLCCSMYCLFCVVLCIVCFVTFSVLFVCICVLNYCQKVATQLQLTNISYQNVSLCSLKSALSLDVPQTWLNNWPDDDSLSRNMSPLWQ